MECLEGAAGSGARGLFRSFAIDHSGTAQNGDEGELGERQRLEALRRFRISKALPNATFDHLTELTAELLGMPTAFLSLIDDRYQWFASRFNLDLPRTTRVVSFCTHTILGSGPMLVRDAAQDERFRDSPLVRGEPRIRFYAGSPLRTSEGHAIGTVSVIDTRPHPDFDPDRMRTLQRIAEAVMAILEGHRHTVEVLERKERDLRESRERLRLAVAATGLGTWDADPLHGIFFWSDEAKEMLGYLRNEEVTEEKFLGRLHPDDRPLVQAAMAHALDPSDRGECTVTFRAVLPDSRMRWLSARGLALFDDVDGRRRAVRFIGTMTDITEREETEQFLRGVLDSLIAFVAVLTPEGTVTYANRLCFEVSGVLPEAVLGKHLADSPWFTYAPEVSACIREAVARARDGGQPHFDIRSKHADGSYLDIELSIAPMRGDPARRYLIASAIDITERKQSETVLRESEERFRNMADHAPVIVWMSGVDGSGSYHNRRWMEFTGQTEEEALGFGWLECTHPDDRARSRAIFLDANGRHASFRLDYRLRRADGSYAWVIDTAAPRFGANGEFLGYIGSVIDISERKAMEEAMQANEERLRITTNAVPAMIWGCDAAGQAVYFNDRWHEYTGLTLEQSRGLGWVEALHPEDVDRAMTLWREVRARGTMYDAELRYRHRSGAYRWMLTRAEPVRDAKGAIVEWTGSSIDIQDLRATEETLRRALADKDMLLREVHHRVKNNLQAVWALIQLETLRLKDNPEGRERLQAVGERLDVLGRLHQQLYRSEDFTRVALAPYLEQLALSLVELHDQGGRISIAVEAEPLACDLDTALPLGLAANELITNSLKHAFPPGRRGTIRLHLHRVRDRFVELVIADDGIGMPTSPGSQGTGLVVIQSLMGQLDAEWSIETDQGTRARLVLPDAPFRPTRS